MHQCPFGTAIFFTDYTELQGITHVNVSETRVILQMLPEGNKDSLVQSITKKDKVRI